MFVFRLVHIMDQRELRRGEGPIALVLVPTRELALQIYTETKRYCRVYNIEVSGQWRRQSVDRNIQL